MKTFGDDAVVSVQNPIVLSEDTEPQPDLAVLRLRADFYAAGHPTREDIFLLIEVAETSADLDRRVKAPLYARGGVEEMWLVDLRQEAVTVYQEPTPGGYRTARVVRRGDRIAPLAFPYRSLAVSDIIG